MPSYPSGIAETKHDVKSVRMPAQGVSLQDEDVSKNNVLLATTPSLFQALKQVVAADTLSSVGFVYSYRDAPTPPLSRELCIVGVAHVSLSVVRKLLGDDDDENDNGSVPDCLHKCTLAVRRGDRDHMKQLDPRHKMNSKAFARLMQRLRNDTVVAILGNDKYGRFGMLKPIPTNDLEAGEKYTPQDFFCRCYVGEVAEIKNFLRGHHRNINHDDAFHHHQQQETSTAMDESASIWQPPSDDGGGFGGGESGSGGGLWQPPGSSGNDGGGDGGTNNTGGLWQPPGGGGDGGADAFSWQPPSSNAFSSFENNAWETNDNNIDNGGSKNNPDAAKRKRDKDGDGEEGSEFHTDTGAAAADAFYSGLTRSLDTRADSRLYHMRAFNGWVKATQIQELDPKTTPTKGSSKKKKNMVAAGAGGPMRILDLACGKGGDLGKWVLHPRGVQDYVGSDVARGSLKDAAIRARGMRHRGLKTCTFTCADLGHDVPGRLRSPKHKVMQKLLTWSLQGEREHTEEPPNFQMARGGGIQPDQMFDVVSIQFAIHYMMSTRQRARRFFHTVSQLLEVGGNLICTTIDARVVLGHLMNLGANLHFDNDNDKNKTREPYEIRVGAGACRIRFEPEIVAQIFQSNSNGSDLSEDLFGLEYTFTLVEGSDHGAGVGDAVNLPEWLTPIPVLEALAKEVGLELEYALNFHEFYKNRKDPSVSPGAHSSLYSMKVLNRDGSISKDEWEISRLYCAVKFRKVSEPLVVLEDDEEQEEDDDDDDEEDFELDIKVKAKLMPMAMLNVKKAVGNESWKTMTPDDKTRLTEIEVRKLAKASAS